MAEETLKIGIAGYGIIGKRRRQFIDRHPRLKTTAVCDVTFPDPGLLPDGAKCFANYKQLLEEPLDVLFVCLPNYLASEVTVAGLEKGLHVFCEKPPGRTVNDIQNVIKIEKKNPGLVLKYGFNHRYHGAVQEALRLIRSGELGEILNMRGVYGKSKVIPFSGGWRAERRYAGGGILLDQGIHMVDLMQLFCGEFVEAKSYVSNAFWKHDVEDNVFALLKNREGKIAMLHSTATQWQHRFSLDITLAKGFLVLRGILSGSQSYGQEELVVGRRDESDVGTTREETIRYIQDNSWEMEIQEFADAVVHKKPIVNGTSLEALETMKLVYRIYASDPDWRETFRIEDPDSKKERP